MINCSAKGTIDYFVQVKDYSYLISIKLEEMKSWLLYAVLRMRFTCSFLAADNERGFGDVEDYPLPGNVLRRREKAKIERFVDICCEMFDHLRPIKGSQRT